MDFPLKPKDLCVGDVVSMDFIIDNTREFAVIEKDEEFITIHELNKPCTKNQVCRDWGWNFRMIRPASKLSKILA